MYFNPATDSVLYSTIPLGHIYSSCHSWDTNIIESSYIWRFENLFLRPHDCLRNLVWSSVSSRTYYNCKFNVNTSFPGNGTLKTCAPQQTWNLTLLECQHKQTKDFTILVWNQTNKHLVVFIWSSPKLSFDFLSFSWLRAWSQFPFEKDNFKFSS